MEESLTEPKPPRKYILKRCVLPTEKKRYDRPNKSELKKTDRVGRYFFYQKEWGRFHFPGENPHKKLRLSTQDQETGSEADPDTFGVMSQEKALDVNLVADPEFPAVIDNVIDFVSETEQASEITSDMIQVSMAETEHLTADTASSDLQKPADEEELKA